MAGLGLTEARSLEPGTEFLELVPAASWVQHWQKTETENQGHALNPASLFDLGPNAHPYFFLLPINVVVILICNILPAT